MEKIKNLFSVLVIAVMLSCTMFMTSCSSDDDDEVTLSAASLSGTAWVGVNSTETGDGYTDIDVNRDIIVFFNDTQFTLYPFENDYNPLSGTYTVSNGTIRFVYIDGDVEEGKLNIKNGNVRFEWEYKDGYDYCKFVDTYKVSTQADAFDQMGKWMVEFDIYR